MIICNKMISLVDLKEKLLTCKNIPYNLGKINSISGTNYLQKDAVQIELIKLELPQQAIDAEASQLKELVAPLPLLTLDMTTLPEITIPSKSIMNYQENTNIVQLPEILVDAFHGIPEMIGRYLYGFKNPESFLKSVLIVSRPDFIIKGKYDRMSTVYTLKKEMGMHLSTYFRRLDYRQMKFKQSVMMSYLISKEHYHSYDFMVLCADYCKINLFIIDILKSSFIEIRCKSLNGDKLSVENYYIFVKYIIFFRLT